MKKAPHGAGPGDRGTSLKVRAVVIGNLATVSDWRWPDAKKRPGAQNRVACGRGITAYLLPANIEYGNRIPYFWHEKSH